MDVCSDHAWIALNDKLSRERMMENIAFDSPEARFLCFRVFHDNLNLSTNLYAHSGLACVSLINEKKGPKKYQKPKILHSYFNLWNFKHLDQV